MEDWEVRVETLECVCLSMDNDVRGRMHGRKNDVTYDVEPIGKNRWQERSCNSTIEEKCRQ